MWKIIFIAITILLIIIGSLYFSVPKEDVTLEHWRTIFSGVTLISIFIAVANYLSNLDASNQDKQRAIDKQLLDQSLLSLEWAYKALTDNAKHIPPKADRLNWLTTARHICRYKELSKEIKLNIYKVICSEHEEYWRHQFYLALDHKIFRSKGYFMNVKKGTNPWGENIEILSAKIIEDFSSWQQDKVDPMSTVGEIALPRMSRGLYDYIEEHENWKMSLEKNYGKTEFKE